MGKIRDQEGMLFVLKRAVRFGKVFRRDLIEAFDGDFGETKASALMSEAAGRWPETLERRSHEIVPRPNPKIPAKASEEDLMKALDYGQTEFRQIGLRVPDELNVLVVKWTRSLPRQPGAFSVIVSSLIHEQPIELLYVGLRRNEQAHWRRVAPLTLEKMGDQWRLIAQDWDDSAAAYPVKVFVLSRILDARLADCRLPPNIIRQGDNDQRVRIPVRLHPDLTPDQQAAICHELMVQDQQISIALRSQFELLRRFSDIPPRANAVWPLIYVEEP
jgi:predicted DNA-binding transcriptional regulator YafY